MRRNKGMIAAAVALLIGGAGISQAQAADIYDTAKEAGAFTILLTAIDAAGLEETIRTTELTVFAPTDEAFQGLPAGTIDKLLANTDLLTELLTYHVVVGTVEAKDVVQLKEATTFQGENVKVSTPAGKSVRINNATVVTADVAADNGVIHVIDKVLMPKNFIGKLNKTNAEARY